MMSFPTQEDARSKFWRVPEMVKKLLEYLDEVSILSILEVKLLTVEVYQAASGTSKDKLIRKVLGFEPPQTFEQQRAKVQRISRNLLAQLDSPQPLLMELLDAICAEHKYVKIFCRWENSAICISSPAHTYHKVSQNGFIL